MKRRLPGAGEHASCNDVIGEPRRHTVGRHAGPPETETAIESNSEASLRPWRLVYEEDAQGCEVLLMLPSATEPWFGTNRIVMMEWEKPYMEALVATLKLRPDDAVLEIGFGCAYSANAIQKCSVRTHTVIECDETVLAQRARGWAASKRNVRLVEGCWQEYLGRLGRFDAVFFDDFPLPAKEAGPTYSRTAACESEAVSGDLGDGMDDAIRFSRWVTLLSELKRGGHLCDGARITGYLARPLSAAELSGIAELGAFEVGWRTYAVTVPQNCPYFDGTELLVPCFVFREALGLDPQPQAYAAHESEVEVEGMLMYMPGSREENPVDSERATRQQLRLPPPKMLRP